MTMMVMVMMTMIMSDFVWLILSSGHSSHFAIGVLLDKAFPDYPSYCICRFFIVPENIWKPSTFTCSFSFDQESESSKNQSQHFLIVHQKNLAQHPLSQKLCPNCTLFLDGVASPSSQWVSDSFRCDAIASPSFASLFWYCFLVVDHQAGIIMNQLWWSSMASLWSLWATSHWASSQIENTTSVVGGIGDEIDLFEIENWPWLRLILIFILIMILMKLTVVKLIFILILIKLTVVEMQDPRFLEKLSLQR